MSGEPTLCWRCNAAYNPLDEHCPMCRAANANVDRDLAAMQAERDRLASELALAKQDAERLAWLEAHPREATIRVGGDMKAATFYGVSGDAKWSMREMIDAAMRDERKRRGNEQT